jgi:chlorophyll synthase
MMSVLYSVPPIRLKARAGWDLVINCLGFGFFTPMAGWAITGKPLTAPVVDACVGFGFLFAALYPMTQIYQVAEDSARGDQTLVIRMGVGRSLTCAIGAALVAHLWFLQSVLKDHHTPIEVFVMTAQGVCVQGTFPKGGPSPAFLAFSLLAWLAVLVPWRLRWSRWTDGQHEAGMYRGLLAWGVTDLSLLILLWPR